MDKFEQLKKEYDLLESSCRLWLDESNEFEYYKNQIVDFHFH